MFTHLITEAKSKFSTNLKPYLHTHDVVDTIETFNQISFDYFTIPPIKIKTRPVLYILRRKDNYQEFIYSNFDESEEEAEVKRISDEILTSQEEIESNRIEYGNHPKFKDKHEEILQKNIEYSEELSKDFAVPSSEQLVKGKSVKENMRKLIKELKEEISSSKYKSPEDISDNKHSILRAVGEKLRARKGRSSEVSAENIVQLKAEQIVDEDSEEGIQIKKDLTEEDEIQFSFDDNIKTDRLQELKKKKVKNIKDAEANKVEDIKSTEEERVEKSHKLRKKKHRYSEEPLETYKEDDGISKFKGHKKQRFRRKEDIGVFDKTKHVSEIEPDDHSEHEENEIPSEEIDKQQYVEEFENVVASTEIEDIEEVEQDEEQEEEDEKQEDDERLSTKTGGINIRKVKEKYSIKSKEFKQKHSAKSRAIEQESAEEHFADFQTSKSQEFKKKQYKQESEEEGEETPYSSEQTSNLVDSIRVNKLKDLKQKKFRSLRLEDKDKEAPKKRTQGSEDISKEMEINKYSESEEQKTVNKTKIENINIGKFRELQKKGFQNVKHKEKTDLNVHRVKENIKQVIDEFKKAKIENMTKEVAISEKREVGKTRENIKRIIDEERRNLEKEELPKIQQQIMNIIDNNPNIINKELIKEKVKEAFVNDIATALELKANESVIQETPTPKPKEAHLKRTSFEYKITQENLRIKVKNTLMEKESHEIPDEKDQITSAKRIQEDRTVEIISAEIDEPERLDLENHLGQDVDVYGGTSANIDEEDSSEYEHGFGVSYFEGDEDVDFEKQFEAANKRIEHLMRTIDTIVENIVVHYNASDEDS